MAMASSISPGPFRRQARLPAGLPLVPRGGLHVQFAVSLEARRHRRRRRVRQAHGAREVVRLQRERGRYPRSVPLARRPALLVRRPARPRDSGPGRRRDSAVTTSSRATPPDPEPGLPNPEGDLSDERQGRPHLLLPPRRQRPARPVRRRHGQPGRGRLLGTGECLGTVNLFYGQPRGDCLVHWVEGGVYPRDDQQDCIAEFPWTGGLLDRSTNYGHVAVSGCAATGDRVWRSDGPLALTQRMPSGRRRTAPRSSSRSSTRTRSCDTVARTRRRDLPSTWRRRDFLISDDPDFHPTDVLEDADGSLLVIDTGGWFRIGCPTRRSPSRRSRGHLPHPKTGRHARSTIRAGLDRSPGRNDRTTEEYHFCSCWDPRPAVR